MCARSKRYESDTAKDEGNRAGWHGSACLIIHIALLLLACPVIHAQGPQPAVKILSAKYGAEPTFVDVTPFVQKVATSSSCVITVGNHTLGGDPVPGKSKILVVQYETADGAFEASAQEGQQMMLPSPTARPLETKLVLRKEEVLKLRTVILASGEVRKWDDIIKVGDAGFTTVAGSMTNEIAYFDLAAEFQTAIGYKPKIKRETVQGLTQVILIGGDVRKWESIVGITESNFTVNAAGRVETIHYKDLSVEFQKLIGIRIQPEPVRRPPAPVQPTISPAPAAASATPPAAPAQSEALARLAAEKETLGIKIAIVEERIRQINSDLAAGRQNALKRGNKVRTMAEDRLRNDLAEANRQLRELQDKLRQLELQMRLNQ